MSKSVGASDARSALTAVEYSRQQVIAEIDMPRWYWLGLAAGWIGIGVIADVGPGWLFAAATLAFGATHAAVAQNVLSGRRRSSALSVRAELVGTRVPALVIGLLVGLSRAHRRGGVVDRCRRCGPPRHDRRRHGGDRGRPRRSGADGRSAPAGAAQRCAMSAEPQFDELIHPSTRLSIVALLAAADWVDFAFVRDSLGLSDSALSKQFATLEGAGYIAIERPLADRRRRVHVRLTDTGRSAFEGHVAALREIVASVDG